MVQDGPGRGRSKTRRRTHGGRASAPPIASTTGARSAAATASTTRTSRSISSSGSRRSGSRRTPWRRTRPTAIQPAFSPRSGIPGQRHSAAAVHRSDVRPGDGAHCGGERRTDAAPVPELVDHLRARIDQQHDGGRVVHRQPRQPPEPSLADTGRRCQHELDPSVLSLGTPRPAVEHQLGSGAPGRHSRRPTRASTATWHRRSESIPQYQNIIWRGVPTGESQYHALELVLERRFSHGLQWRVGYTYSHSA